MSAWFDALYERWSHERDWHAQLMERARAHAGEACPTCASLCEAADWHRSETPDAEDLGGPRQDPGAESVLLELFAQSRAVLRGDCALLKPRLATHADDADARR